MFKVGVIGCGNMGEAIIKGLIEKAGINSTSIVVNDINKERQNYIVEKYNVAGSDIRKVVNLSEIVFLVVKPKDLQDSLESIKDLFKENQILISVLAGVKIEKIKSIVEKPLVVRIMPNTPALIGEGVIGVSFEKDTEKKQEIIDLLKGLGEVFEVKEELLDVITGLSGSGPAYVFTFIDALAQGGVKMGLPYQDALKIATQTVLGAAKLLKETGEHPAVLRDTVSSPAGTTIYGLHELEKKNFKDAVISAVETATKRSKEL
ncbi:pyrroline-5-carboxylate reductase [Sulfurihydrogenibium azorense Az-Fu1]|uniref:Pyrroline-5-carboxylate reductase n=1 Tax=Sulfurihydrogenibium azorense (strain DSM 15241 / OCM 825 / Az-Fu1) TaxID=204536 RepID=C1DWW0_SULAA|nr:pyrroline-5-carboxylate reductase [Sulfurihydrogenibium azorense]ACN98738.1 pyrroline-5-carboxylate reductase [Sulfurihydrogenibium azorense Az-Fu1]